MKRHWISWVILALAVASCQPPIRDRGVDAETHSAFDLLRDRQTATLLARIDPAIQAGAGPKFAAMENLLPPGDPQVRRTLGTYTVQTGSDITVSTTDEYDYPAHSVLVDSLLHRGNQSQPWVIQGLHIRVATKAELAGNHFSLLGKSFAEYLFLALTIASPALMLAAFVKVIRTRGLRRKWLWCLAAFFGVASFHMNWTTGEISNQALTLQFIGAGVLRGASAFSQWILTFTVPIGALLIVFGVWARPRPKRDPVVSPAPQA